MDFYQKYLKYKNKYLDLKSQIGGITPCDPSQILAEYAQSILQRLRHRGIYHIKYITHYSQTTASCNVYWYSDRKPDSIAGTGPQKNHIDMYLKLVGGILPHYYQLGFSISVDDLPPQQQYIGIDNTNETIEEAIRIISILGF